MCTNENLENGESVCGSRDQDGLYGNEIADNKETNLEAFTNTTVIDITVIQNLDLVEQIIM